MTLYAIDKRTKEHKRYDHVYDIPTKYVDNFYYVEADSDGWIPWSGEEEKPVKHNAICSVEFKSGGASYGCPAWEYDWVDVRRYQPQALSILDADEEPRSVLDVIDEAIERVGRYEPEAPECKTYFRKGEERDMSDPLGEYLARRDLLVAADALDAAAREICPGHKSPADQAWRIGLIEVAKGKRREAGG